MYWSKIDGNEKSSRLSVRRVKSARELYRPAIADLSEQAGWNINRLENNLVSFTVTHVPSDPQYSSDDVNNDNNNVNRKQGKTQETPDTSTLISPLCISPKLPNVYEQYRRRVIISAHQRHRLTNIKRAKSVEPSATPLQTPRSSISYTSNLNKPENDGDIISFVITNSMNGVKQQDDKRKTTPIIKRSKNTSIGGTLLSDGFKGQPNGFHHHLITTHPKTKQRISMWLTSGFKIQSFRSQKSRASTACMGNGYDNKRRNRLIISDKKLIEDLKKIRLDENEDVVVYDNCESNKRVFSARGVDTRSLTFGLMVNGIRYHGNGS